MRELSLCALRDGLEPTVIARRAKGVAAYRDIRLIEFDYPVIYHGNLSAWVCRLERKFRGWTRLRQGPWMKNILSILMVNGLSDRPLVIFNEPELAVFLSKQLNTNNIFLWLQNQLPCKPKARNLVHKSCRRVFGVSAFTTAWAEKYFALEQAFTVYNGVNVNEFRPAEDKATGPAVIQFVGRTGVEKAPDLLLRACLRLAAHTSDFQVRLVGSNHWDRFTEDAFQLQLGDLSSQLSRMNVKVEQTGHIDRHRLPKLMQTAHIHVTPSRWDEPFGLTTLEGMASGLAVCASDTGGTREIVGDAGFLFTRDNEFELAELLKQLIANPSMRTRVAQKCRQRSLDFTWDKSWARLSLLLNNCEATTCILPS